jgi:hypothetical protein
VPHFDIPLNLPHASRIMARIATLAVRRHDGTDYNFRTFFVLISRLQELLLPWELAGDNPADAEQAERVRQEAAELGRHLATEIHRLGVGEDRLGQCIRNLFECLAMGREGADLGLKAGENPGSAQRPL